MMPQPSLVCVSFNFPPQNDAEALCTARLLSCIAQAGWRVHLVTVDHDRSLEESIEQELVDPDIQITRIPRPGSSALRLRWCQARHGLHLPNMDCLEPMVRSTRQLLEANPGSVLMTRAMPVISNLVGYCCRQSAAAWVAHFSDPYPIEGWKQRHRFSDWVRPLHRRWARRILQQSDLVTVTCPNAVRYMEHTAGCRFQEKTHVLPHLARPELKPGRFVFDRRPDEFWLAHIGNLMAQRNPLPLLEGVCRAAKQIPGLRFLQYGHVDSEVLSLVPREELDRVLVIKPIENLSPREAADLQRQVDVNVIVDTDFGLDYSPLILSKFPHSVCSGRPLLMLSQADSAMGDCYRQFGGGQLASYRDPVAIETAILELHQARMRRDDSVLPSEPFQQQFAPAAIITPFLKRIESLLSVRMAGKVVR